MKDDFLSVKKIADWDDIESNKYQVSSEDDEDHLGDEYDLKPDVAFLEFILGRIQQVKHDNKEPSLFPRSLKTLPDECDDPGSGSSTVIGCFGRDTGHEETLWSDAFSNYISLQIQKLKNNSPSKESFCFPPSDRNGDNTSNQQHDSNKVSLKQTI
ncbi:hypothetical protein K443DRAFT_292339 [Laccaria amethystina LaAM-08-1]|uniref:Uncharacterized protein n=1 Tax=Laccaria amethystina LaAM-08-1 TaxID=1095629 RepID=A0A0C9X4L4_9AGAR|nr:hypothetical protein K443DRAFT_292339 [Laccaria amethystina LaAM-08-1]